jgi:hypothetical protein
MHGEAWQKHQRNDARWDSQEENKSDGFTNRCNSHFNNVMVLSTKHLTKLHYNYTYISNYIYNYFCEDAIKE